MVRSKLIKETRDFVNHVRSNFNPDMPIVFWVDLFCGAGGTSTGIHLANATNVYVAACVNHDANAIKSHAENHPSTLHFTEDIRDFKVVENLIFLVEQIRKEFPECKIKIWASLECTNFSKAKGGMARDADSRTLAEHMFMYLALNPDVFWFENVREFMSWGPLDEKGKPLSRKNGSDYISWVEKLQTYGYGYDHKILNSADFGAYQSRERLFIQFPKKGLPFIWPAQTHSKKGAVNSLFDIPKWKPVRDVLDLEDEGRSIFDRKKPLSENTEKRILAGLEKFVAKGEDTFIKKYYSGRPAGKVISIDGPAGTVKTIDGQAVVQVEPFITQRNTGHPKSKIVSVDGPARTITQTGGNQDLIVATHLNTYYGTSVPKSINEPSPTVTTRDRIAKIDVVFVDQQYGNSKPASLDIPLGTLTGNPKFALVSSKFIANQYSGGGQLSDINAPSATVLNIPKQNLVSTEQWIMDTNFNNIGRSIEEPSKTLVASRRHPYLVNANSSTSPPLEIDNPAPSVTSRTHLIINPSWFGHASGIDEPSVTIIARQDKSPLYLMAAENGPIAWIVFEEDSETMIKIKRFMVEHGITDIKMRMLKIPELLQIQGFPKDYKLIGTQTEQKKYIGNAVEVNMARALALADYELEKRIAV